MAEQNHGRQQVRIVSKTQSGLFIGRHQPEGRAEPMGFGRRDDREPSRLTDDNEVTYSRDGHAITFSPTGGGKGVCSVIPNALRHPGQLIVFDPKGQVYEASNRQRRRFGEAHRLDLRDSEKGGASLNPVDLMRLSGSDPAAVARSFAADIVERSAPERERFWGDWAETLMTGGLVWQMTSLAPGDQRLSGLFDLFTNDDVAYAIAVLLDSGQVKHRAARTAFTSFLQLPERENRPSVLASTLQHLRLFDSDLVRRLTDTTSFDLDALIEGAPMTLCITAPPGAHERLPAAAPLLARRAA